MCKVLSLLEGCFDLIASPSPSMKIQIVGSKITKKPGVLILATEGQKKIVLFLFIVKFSIKNCISLFLAIFEYLVLQIILLFNGRIITWFRKDKQELSTYLEATREGQALSSPKNHLRKAFDKWYMVHDKSMYVCISPIFQRLLWKLGLA